jgi:hypothetical protein
MQLIPWRCKEFCESNIFVGIGAYYGGGYHDDGLRTSWNHPDDVAIEGLLFHIRDVPGSSLDPNTGYRNLYVCCFPQSVEAIAGIAGLV